MPPLWGRKGWLGDPACHPLPAFHARVCVVFRHLSAYAAELRVSGVQSNEANTILVVILFIP